MSKQIDFLKRCIALNLQSGGLLDLLDRIEELERENNELAARIGKELNEENLALRAEIAELVAALELLSKYIAYNGDDWVQRTALEALAKVRKP